MLEVEKRGLSFQPVVQPLQHCQGHTPDYWQPLLNEEFFREGQPVSLEHVHGLQLGLIVRVLGDYGVEV